METLPFSVPEIIMIILSLLAGVILLKVVVSFDINAWMKTRADHKQNRLKMLCPHTEITIKDDGSAEVKSLFHSPYGTTAWICSRCQLSTFDSSVPEQFMKIYAENPRLYIERVKKFEKLACKTYGL